MMSFRRRMMMRLARAVSSWSGHRNPGAIGPPLSAETMLWLTREISEQLVEEVHVLDQSGTRTGCQTIWVEGRRPYIVKLALVDDAGPRLEANAKALAAATGIAVVDPPLASVIPRIVRMGRFDGRIYSIETALPGRKATDFLASARAREKVTQQGHRFLMRLHTLSRDDAVLDSQTWNRQFQPMIQTVGSFVRLHDPAGTYDRIDRLVRDRLLDQSVPLVFAHGNFWIGNLLYDPHQGLTGVIDWDSAVPRGLPLVDLVYFLVRTETLIDHTSLGEAITKLIAMDLKPLEAHPMVGEYCRAFSIPTAWLKPLFYYCWIQHVNIQVHYRTPVLEKASWLKKNLIAVLSAIRRSEEWDH